MTVGFSQGTSVLEARSLLRNKNQGLICFCKSKVLCRRSGIWQYIGSSYLYPLPCKDPVYAIAPGLGIFALFSPVLHYVGGGFELSLFYRVSRLSHGWNSLPVPRRRKAGAPLAAYSTSP